MIHSSYQIDFIDEAGNATRLLNVDDLTDAIIEFATQQAATGFASLGKAWGGSIASGGARRPLSWSRLQEHASHAAAAGFSIRNPAAVPFYRPGKLRVTTSGGEVWDMLNAIILDAATRMSDEGEFATLATYSCEAGETVPVSGLAHYAGIPHAWILTDIGDQTLTHAAL